MGDWQLVFEDAPPLGWLDNVLTTRLHSQCQFKYQERKIVEFKGIQLTVGEVISSLKEEVSWRFTCQPGKAYGNENISDISGKLLEQNYMFRVISWHNIYHGPPRLPVPFSS